MTTTRDNLRNGHFVIQINVLHGVNQLNTICHGFLERFTSEDQTHTTGTLVNYRRAHRIAEIGFRPLPHRRS